MYCAWESFVRLLPAWMRQDVDRHGKDSLQELRLRIGYKPLLVMQNRTHLLNRTITKEDIYNCINTASGFSPWAAPTIADGYITAPGGHRIGICGDAVIMNDKMTGIRTAAMLCIRVARDFPGIAKTVQINDNSILIIGRPGAGKTTLMRDLIRNYSNTAAGSIGVVDERGELFPQFNGTSCFDTGKNTDIITGCNKGHGISLLLRCMGPEVIAVDEITSEEDCGALEKAAFCGVRLFATAHAHSRSDLLSRPVYKQIIEQRIFDTLVVLHSDKSFHVERICL